MAAKWLYEWRHHVVYDPNDGDYRGIELCRESATELLALLDAERPVVGHGMLHAAHEAYYSHIPIITHQDAKDALERAIRVALTYKEATDG